ncbi:MAG TPA: hypothetical protein PLN06_08685 [Bacteroidales bacterium]|nr:hypothetical protein [Bacteroidales bacterium]HOU96682.1 hypothetical protein [Bacteroidales bacterium]HQG37095.1 hypothetical protein [Bacteroidales bacterium]HQG52440.1 hypothetical protein [Bacteroidales bacterium]HQJ21507.1 hypothetical protein [Bacteroidales bacterium]
MTLQRRKFTPEDRLSILQEGEREGHTKTLRKYQIAPSLCPMEEEVSTGRD